MEHRHIAADPRKAGTEETAGLSNQVRSVMVAAGHATTGLTLPSLKVRGCDDW